MLLTYVIYKLGKLALSDKIIITTNETNANGARITIPKVVNYAH